MLAAIDWRDDASLPTRVAGWRRWTVAMVLVAVLFTALVVAAIRLVNEATADACLAQQARDGATVQSTGSVDAHCT